MTQEHASCQFVLDCGVRRTGGGRVLVGGAPARLVRLTAAGASVLDAVLAGSPPPAGAEAGLIRPLLEHGLLHPQGTVPRREQICVPAVVPVRNGAAWIGETIRALRACGGEVVVIDDGSTDGSMEAAVAAGARMLSNARTPGPSGARNTGLVASAAEFVALVDADCVVEPSWHVPLTALLDDDPRLAAVAPRVLSRRGASVVAAYERACSPLDLGPNPALVGRGRRLSYVPSAALLVRREALLEVGYFDESLSIGEDVDLVWRLIEAGWRVRYAPESRVSHRPRETVVGLALQRARYGASSVLLGARHPGGLPALRVSPSTLATWTAGAASGAPAAVAVGAVSGVLAASGARARCARRELARFTLRGHVHATRHLARVGVREWLPLTALVAARSRRVRRLVLLAFAIDVLASRDTATSPALVPHAFLRTVDNTAYALGLWRTALRTRSARAVALFIAGRSH